MTSSMSAAGQQVRRIGPRIGEQLRRHPRWARPLAVAGAVLAMVGALLPWATFVLNKGAYPGRATLHLFDAPLLLASFRLQVFVLGAAALAVAFVPVPGRGRVLRGLGWGAVLVAVVNLVFIAYQGGGLGAVTASEKPAFGGFIALASGVLLLAAAT